MKALRQRFAGKQLCLAVIVGCTEAAVSLWETGKRLPNARTFFLILRALEGAGAPPSELVTLGNTWVEAASASRRAALPSLTT